MDSKNLIITNKGNFFDLMNMTMQLCASMEERVKKHASVGLSNERDYWGALQEQMRKVLPE